MHESALGYLECIRVHEIVLATWVKGVHLSPVSALVSHDPRAVALTASLLGLCFDGASRISTFTAMNIGN